MTDSFFQRRLLFDLTTPFGAVRAFATSLEQQAGDGRRQLSRARQFFGDVVTICENLGQLGASRLDFKTANSIEAVLDVLETSSAQVPMADFVKQVTHPRLRALQDRYEGPGFDVNAEGSDSTLFRFANIGTLENLTTAMRKCSLNLNNHMESMGTQIDSSKKFRDVNYDAWKISREIYEALWNIRKNDCEHCGSPSFRLGLATQHKSINNVDLEFIVSLKDVSCRAQEIEIKKSAHRSSKRTAKAVGVAGVPQPRGAKRPKPALSKVVEICKTIQIAQGSGTRLCFLIDEEALWQEQGRQSDYSAALLENTISLSDISMDYEARVTDKTRLILAVIFGYTLLYHFGTSWLQDWNRDKIVFLRSDRHVPLKPFLLYNYANCQGEELVDPNQVHWYPEILSLGIILLELHLQTPIIAYLRPDGLSAEEKENVNLPFFLAQEVLEACKDDLNRHYRAAINACLQPSFGDHLDEDDSDYDIQFRREIYNEIVKPLEKDLEDCFGDIVDVEKLDDEAKNLDIFNFGQRIHLRSAHSTSTANVTNETMMSAQPAPSMLSPTSEPEQRLYVLGSPSALSPVRTPSPMRHMLGMNTRGTSSYVDAGVSNLKGSLFDGMITDIEESIDHPGFGVTNNWFERLEKLFHSKMKLNDNVQTPVKIAILDSGIDLKHPGIRLCRPRIKDVRSWVNGSKGEVDKTSGDSLGHGTHVAGLIFAMAPLAEVYVAKITCGSALENTDHIAKAIEHATKNWKVDIINMSFGFANVNHAMHAEISSSHCVIFAAASNDGGNTPRAYPARQDGVICIHSTDGRGNNSSFNPTPLDHCDNFGIIGEYVESTWPGKSADGEPNYRRKSGTSFATPVAAGISAAVLEFARQKVKDEGLLKVLSSHGGMCNMLRKISQPQRYGLRYIAPWTLFEHEDGEAGAIRDIREALR